MDKCRILAVIIVCVLEIEQVKWDLFVCLGISRTVCKAPVTRECNMYDSREGNNTQQKSDLEVIQLIWVGIGY